MKTLSALLATSLLLTAPHRASLAAEPGEGAKPAGPVVTVPTFGNATCPIMGKPTLREKFADTDFGRIYVCCPPCIKKILLDPEKAYKTAYPTTKKVGNTVCPVTGETLGPNAVTVLLQGYEVGVCGPECVKRAQANAQIVLTKVLDTAVVDIGNRTCPITGQAVADNAFCLIDKDLVHLSSPKAVEDVKKDPEKARQAAKDIAAKQGSAGSPPPQTPK